MGINLLSKRLNLKLMKVDFDYTGNIAEWKNNMFVGGLSGQHIASLVIKNNKVVGEESLLADKNERWRCIATGKDGAIYAATDGGKLYRIAKQ